MTSEIADGGSNQVEAVHADIRNLIRNESTKLQDDTESQQASQVGILEGYAEAFEK
jgi:hypothetical protein